MKYSEKLADEICALVATGNHTIMDICIHKGITKETFYQWKKTQPYFSDHLKHAEEQRLASLGELAVSGLALLLTKHEYEEITTEYTEGKDGKPKIKSQKKARKFIMPNPISVIFALTNRSPDQWKNKQSIDHGNIDVNINISDDDAKLGS